MKMKIFVMLIALLIVLSSLGLLSAESSVFLDDEGPDEYSAFGNVTVTDAEIEVVEWNEDETGGSDGADGSVKCKINFEFDFDDINWSEPREFDSLSVSDDSDEIIDYLQENLGNVIEISDVYESEWNLTEFTCGLVKDIGTSYYGSSMKLTGNITIKDNKFVFSGEGYDDDSSLKSLDDLDPAANLFLENSDRNCKIHLYFDFDDDDVKLN